MEEQGVSQELMTLPGGDSRPRASPGHHSPCLGGSPTLCPSLLPAGEMLKNQIAEMCSPPPRSFLLLDALRPGEQVSRGWQASALLDSLVGGRDGLLRWEGFESTCGRRPFMALFCLLPGKGKDSPTTHISQMGKLRPGSNLCCAPQVNQQVRE